MAEPMSGLDMVREIIGQINNLRKLVTVNGKTYKYDPKSKSYKADGKSFTPSQLKAELKGQSYTAPKIDNKSKLKVKPKLKPKTTPTPKTTAKKTKTNKTKGVKQKTQYKTTGKPPVQVKPKKLIKGASKILKKIRKVPGAGMVGRGVARAGGIAGGIGMGLGLKDNLVDHAREVTNVVQRIRNKPFKTFGATGYEKKLIEKSEERRKKKNTNNNKVKINKKDKNTNTDKKETAYDKLRSGKPTGLANLPKNEGRVVVKGRGGKATRVNPDYGVKGQPDKVVNENKRTSKIKDKKSTNKKRLTARERLRAKNREIHGDAANKVYEYNKAWQKARREGRLEEFKKKNKARRHWQ